MNKRFFLTCFLLLFYSVVISVYWLRAGFSNDLLREGVYLSAPLLAVIAGLVALFKFGFSGSRSYTIMLMTAGIAYWFLGELFFDYYQYIVHIDTSPSAADIFYILGYPFLFAGLVNEIKVVGISRKNFQRPLFILPVTVALLLGGIVSYFGIYKAYDATMPSAANLISLSYGVGDLLLILTGMFVLLLAWEFRGGALSRIWLTVCLSMVLILVADILFAFYSMEYANQVWFYKSLLDSFWIAAYLLFAYAFFEFSFSLQDAYRKILQLAKKS